MSKRFFFAVLTVILALTMMFPASSGQAQQGVGPQASLNPRFRVVIGANLSTTVDVWLDGVLTVESGANAVQPLNYSGSIVVPAGSHTISVSLTGTTGVIGMPITFDFAPWNIYQLHFASRSYLDDPSQHEHATFSITSRGSPGEPLAK